MGTDDFSLFHHFDGNDSTGSAEEGYGRGELWPNQWTTVDVDYTCSFNEGFREDMYLDENGTIQIKMTFNIYSGIVTINVIVKSYSNTKQRGIDGCIKRIS